jgi:hypothetical protein
LKTFGSKTIVLSTEECGLPISDSKLTKVNEKMGKILDAIRHLSAYFPLSRPAEISRQRCERSSAAFS